VGGEGGEASSKTDNFKAHCWLGEDSLVTREPWWSLSLIMEHISMFKYSSLLTCFDSTKNRGPISWLSIFICYPEDWNTRVAQYLWKRLKIEGSS
jgi:hypothetical protein